MDPNANLEQQLELAREIIERAGDGVYVDAIIAIVEEEPS